jgi:glucose-1-phosphate adenylyltransferase
VPFGGKYRIIDFILSNYVNSGIYDVSIITRNNYHSLVDHLGAGKEWDLTRKIGGLRILSPF